MSRESHRVQLPHLRVKKTEYQSVFCSDDLKAGRGIREWSFLPSVRWQNNHHPKQKQRKASASVWSTLRLRSPQPEKPKTSKNSPSPHPILSPSFPFLPGTANLTWSCKWRWIRSRTEQGAKEVRTARHPRPGPRTHTRAAASAISPSPGNWDSRCLSATTRLAPLDCVIAPPPGLPVAPPLPWGRPRDAGRGGELAAGGEPEEPGEGR